MAKRITTEKAGKEKKVDKPKVKTAPSESTQELFNKLTRLQKYTALGVLSGLTQRQAYYDAGGIARSDEAADATASQLLSNHKVKAFMDASEAEALTDTIMTKREAMERLSIIARTTVKDIATFRKVEVVGADGAAEHQTLWALKGDEEISEEAAAIISELSAGRDGLKFKTHSPLAAIKELSGMIGWDAPKKMEHTGKDGEKLFPDFDPAKLSSETLKELLDARGPRTE